MRLRKLKPEDAEKMLEWMHDPEVAQNFREGIENRTETDVISFIEKADVALKDHGNIHYAIVDDTDEYMGTISLKNINLQDKNAEYAISLRKKAQGKGMARAATKELLAKAFVEFGLHKVYLNVMKGNKRAISLYEKTGFRFEGEFIDHLFARGEYKSLCWYAIRAEEYFAGKNTGIEECGGNK